MMNPIKVESFDDFCVFLTYIATNHDKRGQTHFELSIKAIKHKRKEVSYTLRAEPSERPELLLQVTLWFGGSFPDL